MPEARTPVWLGQGELVLRPWQEDDLAALVANANHPGVVRGLSSRFPHPYSDDDGRAFLAGRVVPLDRWALAICRDGQACGGIAITAGAGERTGTASLGYWLGPAHWNQGVMGRVLALYVPWVMADAGLHRLLAEVMEHNPVSARVLLRHGFVEEGSARWAVRKDGVLRDLRRFALVRPVVDGRCGGSG